VVAGERADLLAGLHAVLAHGAGVVQRRVRVVAPPSVKRRIRRHGHHMIMKTTHTATATTGKKTTSTALQ